MGKAQVGSRYAARCERFTWDLSFAAVQLAPQYDNKVDFAGRVETAARDLDSHGLSSPDWRHLVNAVTDRAWDAARHGSPAPPFTARGYRALVARDRCGCGHERLHHFDHGGSTIGCQQCACGSYALAGVSAARPREVVHA